MIVSINTILNKNYFLKWQWAVISMFFGRLV